MNNIALGILLVFLILFILNLIYLGYITFKKYKDVYQLKVKVIKALN